MPRTALALVVIVLVISTGFYGPPSSPSPDAYAAHLEGFAREYEANALLEDPTAATDAGIHRYDDRLADYSAGAQAADYARLVGFRNRLAALQPAPDVPIHDQVNYLLLRSNLESEWWSDTVLQPLQRNPSVYEGECSNGIFSLIKKKFAADEVRIRAAIARLRACPAVLEQGKSNLTDTVREFAKVASEDVGSGDALYTTSLDAIAGDVSPATRAQLHAAQSIALQALHAYKAWLDSRMNSFHAGGFAVGKAQYDWYLRRVLLLPWNSDEIARIGRTELARDRALAAWERNVDAHASNVRRQPTFTNTAAFLKFYEAQTATLIAFVKSHGIVDLPPYLGPFHIVELPKALAAVNPGGFMNPPGMFDANPEGFYFVPDYDPRNTSFFAAQARVAVMPVLGHEGIPGHFLQFSYAYHNPDFIRHIQQDEVFAEGWAFYGEEMLMRNGLYKDDPQSRDAVIHLMRHRATRVGVDIGLATGSMTLPQAIAYFRSNAGIDEVTAAGEGTRFAMFPGQAIDYLIGKVQIESLLGDVQDREGTAFSLRRFHDQLLSYGTVPYATVRWEWLRDPSWIAAARDPLEPQNMAAVEK
jgi:uncharacterized protein (DUF885 family)